MKQYMIENLFGIEGWNITWYGVIITFAMILGIWIAYREAGRVGINKELIIDFVLIAIPIAIICARLYYVAFEWEHYKDNLFSVFMIWKGGLAIYGGVIGGFITAIAFCRCKKISLFKFVDVAVPSLVLGQAIGRWGNFANQEAYGEVVLNSNLQFFPYAVYIEKIGEWHQATFFYESMWNGILFIILMLLKKKKWFEGQLLCTYFIGYGIGRFLIEGLRTDSLYVLEGLRVSQLVSIMLIIIGSIGYVYKAKRRK